MITQSLPAPVFGRDGEPCPACGAPLAADQRYCLHCGVRRPEARLEFLDVLDADVRVRSAGPIAPGFVGAAGGVGGGQPPQGLNGRLQANSGLIGLGALLLLTLLIGLLVGHWATSTSTPQAASAPAPQVIKVEGGATAPAAATSTGATADGGSGGTTSSSSSKAKAKSGAKSDASEKATAPKDAVSVKSLSSKKAVEDAVKKGKPISTGTGKLPAKDNKAPGGGSAVEEIG